MEALFRQLGYDSEVERDWQSLAEPGQRLGRVCRATRRDYTILGVEDRPVRVRAPGRMFRDDQAPTVGDWVGVRGDDHGRWVIACVLPRRSAFYRRAAGRVPLPQVVAANIDTLLIVSGLDGELNLRRLERYLALAWQSGAVPVFVLNKVDLCADLDDAKALVSALAADVPLHLVCGKSGDVGEIRQYVAEGRTCALLGSSGVGKSTLINALVGEQRMEVGEVREDDRRGRHTTTHRELCLVSDGGVLIDTPGMRELQLWGDARALDRVFAEIAEVAARCRFGDCRHRDEPNCAVREAVGSGEIDAARLSSLQELFDEFAELAEALRQHRNS